MSVEHRFELDERHHEWNRVSGEIEKFSGPLNSFATFMKGKGFCEVAGGGIELPDDGPAREFLILEPLGTVVA